MTIQYRGFEHAGASRVYNFVVTEGTEEARKFTVKILLAVFRATGLRFQDGPEICSDRLRQELAGESEGSRAASHLTISPGDSQEFLDRRHPRKHKPLLSRLSLSAGLYGKK